MPTYDYQCRACGSVTEVIHAMIEEGPTVCDRCGGALRRIIYPSGIIFKGPGFFRTDSRTTGAGSSGGDASTPKSSDGTSDGAKPTEKVDKPTTSEKGPSDLSGLTTPAGSGTGSAPSEPR